MYWSTRHWLEFEICLCRTVSTTPPLAVFKIAWICLEWYSAKKTIISGWISRKSKTSSLSQREKSLLYSILSATAMAIPDWPHYTFWLLMIKLKVFSNYSHEPYWVKLFPNWGTSYVNSTSASHIDSCPLLPPPLSSLYFHSLSLCSHSKKC